jgi:predicted  nucleic acid-binding Zn-ribbon protein
MMTDREVRKALRTVSKLNTALRISVERLDIAAMEVSREMRRVTEHVNDLRARMAQFYIDVQNVCENQGTDDTD